MLMRKFFLGQNGLLRQRWAVGIGGALGLALTAVLFLGIRQNAWDEFRIIFTQRAIIRNQNIAQELERQLDRLDGLRRFMTVGGAVERKEFDAYAAPLLNGVSPRALEWIPRVPRSEYLSYETSAKHDGLEGYQINEKDAQGKNIPALARDEYFPVYYVQPVKGNEAALGFDLASEPVRRSAMEKCRDTGGSVVTPPVVLVQEGKKNTGILIFMPVYAQDLPKDTVDQRRKSLKGFVLAVYNADKFFNGIFSRLSPEDLLCLIEDPAASKDRRVLYRAGGTVDWDHPLFTYEMSLKLSDRQWHAVITPGAVFIKKNLSKMYRWIIPFGLFLTAWLTIFLNFLATAKDRAESLVKQRTKELSEQKDELQKSREEVRLILNSVGEAIYGIDLEGRCTFCNPVCLEILGYKEVNDLIGKNMHWVCHHSYADKTKFPVERCRIFQAFQQGEGTHVDDEVLWRSDGSSFPAEYWSFPQRVNGKVTGAVVTFVDITGRKKAQNDLLKSEERYHQIASAITDYIYTVFVESGRSTRTQYNPACLAVTGYRAEEYLKDTMLWFNIIVEEDRDIVLEQIKDIHSGHKDLPPIEHRIYRKDGQIRWVKNTIVSHFDAQGILIAYDGLISDITARKEAEKVLEDQKRALDEHAIVSRSDPQGRITYVNDKFCQISKYSREELLGCEHTILNSGYHPETFFTHLWERISGGNVWQGHIRNRARDGSYFWLASTIVPFKDIHDRVKEYINVSTDITKNIENEERLEAAMLIKSNFVSTASHELRTPLAAIKSSIDILSTEIPGKLVNDQKVFLGRVKNNVDRLARLINDVLDLSKLESGKMTMNLVPFDCRELVKDVVDMQRAVVKDRPIMLETEFETDLPTLSADRDRLTQVLNNLINNALKFTLEGKVTVMVSCTDKKMMVFTVRDTGPGIKEEDLPKLFVQFQQVGASSHQVSGTGLGLAISKEIVEKHGGSIRVTSKFGEGSAFIFTIPVKGI